jgi:hypothetical protein
MMLTMQIEEIHRSSQVYQTYHNNVGTLMRLFLATGPYYIILLFHLHTTSRVCNIIASGLTVPRSRNCHGSRLQMARIPLGTLARTCCRPLFGRCTSNGQKAPSLSNSVGTMCFDSIVERPTRYLAEYSATYAALSSLPSRERCKQASLIKDRDDACLEGKSCHNYLIL